MRMRMLYKKSIDIFTYKQWLLSLDMKTKVVQHVPRILFNVFKVFKLSSFQVFKFSKFSGSQHLSDFQTFLAGNQLYERSTHGTGCWCGCCQKNVWKSDRRWEPENFENLKTLKTLKMILGTCWTTFVFMSMLKSRCFYVKIAMVFLGPPPQHHHPMSLPILELVPG